MMRTLVLQGGHVDGPGVVVAGVVVDGVFIVDWEELIVVGGEDVVSECVGVVAGVVVVGTEIFCVTLKKSLPENDYLLGVVEAK